MSERQDYIALDWVSGEIGETLKQAAQALEAYIANRDDVSKLRFCLTHIHQVHGTLQMVEFFGAALLAEEMEGLAHDLSQGSIHTSHIDDALAVLQNAISQLPLYLEKVKKNRHGLPATLLPVLNDLRAVRGESLLSETVLFSPNMPVVMGKLDGAALKITVSEFADVTHKLRQMFQIALLGLIRGNELKKNLNYMAKVCARLVKLTEGYPSQSLWRICIAVLEGMLNGSINASVAVKILLRQVDRQIKAFIDEGEAALDKSVPNDLIKNLLYYVARSKADSRFIKEIKTEYHLEASLLGDGELADEELATPDSSTMRSVVEALVHELQAIQTAFKQANNEAAQLADVLPLFKRVSDTMAILGLGSALKHLQEPYSRLARLLATQGDISEQELADISSQLALAVAELNPLAIIADKEAPGLFNDSEEAQSHLESAFVSVVQESRNGLERAKETIVEFVATQWNHDCLVDLPGLLAEIGGSLNMLPLSRAAKVLRACEQYVSQTLLANNTIPEWQMLDTLADAITSVDYYLERLVDDNSPVGESILDVAAGSVAQLGYPIEDTAAVVASKDQAADFADEQLPPILSDIAEPAANTLAELPMLADTIDFPVLEKPQTDSAAEQDSPDLEAAVNEPQVTAAANTVTADGDGNDEDFDSEIIEIFVEEAGEVIETINECVPQWQANTTDKELGSTLRRAFHTLKGSGRMVGATALGELAWSIENMLNRVQDGTVAMDQQRFDLIAEAVLLVPGLVSAFEQRQPVDAASEQLIISRAELLAQQQNPVLENHFADVDIAAITDVHADPLAEQQTLEGSSETVAEELEEELDAELLEIFTAETAVHGQVLDEFIDRCQQLAGPAEFTDELQRALHTLKGSANMAGIIPIASVVTPLEYVVKELRASQLKVDEPLLLMLERGSLLIKAGIHQLALSPLQQLPATESYNEELLALFNERMAQAALQAADDNGIPPAALNLFLTESLDLITEMSGKLMLWQQGENDEASTSQLGKLMDRFIHHASSVNMLAPMELGEAMQAFYRRSMLRQPPMAESFFALANAANDGLIDMLDQIAGHQTPVMDAALFNQIQDYEFDHVVEPVVDSALETDMANDDSSQLVDPLTESLLSASDPDATISMPIVDIGEIENGEQSSAEALSAEHDALLEAELPATAAAEASTPPAAVTHVEADSDADIDEEIVEIFLEEADDLLENLDESLHAWTDDRSNRSYLDDLLRILHTLKGGARLAKLVAVGDLSHDFETVLTRLEHQTSALDDTTLNEIQRYQDLLVAHMVAIKSGEPLASTALFSEAAVEQAAISAVDKDDSDEVEAVSDGDSPAHGVVIEDDHLEEQDGIISEPTTVDVENKKETLAEELHAAFEEQLSTEEEPLDVAEEEDYLALGDALGKQLGSELIDIEDAEFDLSAFAGEDEIETQQPSQQPPESPVPAEQPAASVSLVRPRQVSPQEILTPLVDLAARKAPQEVVKVSAQLLEELVNLAGETSISRGRAEEQISELVFSLDDMQVTVDRLQEQVRRLDMETEQQILYRQEQVESEGLEGFDPLEMDRYSQLQQLSRSLLESSSDLVDIKNTLSDKSRDMETLLIQQSRINTDLQEGLMRSRMVPFSRMVPRLRRIVRQVSGELHKQVDLHLKNVEGELDRTVLERMVSPLEHMLRNAVDHGIESAERRSAAGKSTRGSVTLELSREGGEIVLLLSDDGAGIDLGAVKNKAIERGLMEVGADLSDHEISQFILHSGFSTAASITQISGRGVGMDVVHSEIKQLGGSMDIDSVAGKGSTFTIRLPFTVSVNRALMVNVGGDSYAIPLNTIEGIVRVSPFELEAYYQPDAPMFEYAGQPYLLRYMGALLNRGDKPILEGQSMPLPVVLVRGADHSVAVQVDSLMGSREIVVKPLGPQFGQVQGLSGATVLGDGSVVVILDLLALIRADASHLHRNLGHHQGLALEQDKSILVMVVDDSVTVRKVTSRFLERQGMEVILAKDGVDAVTQLQEIERIPDVMLLDIEMPRMDGFEVANRVRHHSRLKDIPIIMITSRTGEKHRDRALALGVNEYLGKPYQESTLLDTIHALTRVPQS